MAGQDDGNMKEAGSNENNVNESNEPPLETSDENVVQEYNQLDSKLDELNTALDFLEQKNDDIQAKLKVLLQSNIEIRQQMRNDTTTSQNQ